MKKIYMTLLSTVLISIVAVGVIFYLDRSYINQGPLLINQNIMKESPKPTTFFNEKNIIYYFRVKELSNCLSGYSFFERWANITSSFKDAVESEDAVIGSEVKKMHDLAVKKQIALRKLIKIVTDDAVIKHGANRELLVKEQNYEYLNTKRQLEEFFIKFTSESDGKTLEFFNRLKKGDQVCRKRVIDIITDKDLEPNYYTGGPPEPKGIEIKYLNQK